MITSRQRSVDSTANSNDDLNSPKCIDAKARVRSTRSDIVNQLQTPCRFAAPNYLPVVESDSFCTLNFLLRCRLTSSVEQSAVIPSPSSISCHVRWQKIAD